MSYPILKAKDGNEFYNNFLGSIEKFRTKYIGPELFGKQLVLYEGIKKRRLTQKEIETYVKIYLLPKIYLFYSKIDYTFTSNIKGYYEYYYDSLNNFNNLCRFYLNKENPVVRKINFDIHKKMQIEQKNINSNTSFYQKIIDNNVEVIGILEIFSNILDKLVIKNKNREKQYRTIQTKLTSIATLITKMRTVYNAPNIGNVNTQNDFLKRLNIIFNFLKTQDLNDTEYKNRKIKLNEFIRDYNDLFELYKQVSLIFKLYDFNIPDFELKLDVNYEDILTKNVNPIIINSRNLVIIYEILKKDILKNIKNIKDINEFIGKLKLDKTIIIKPAFIDLFDIKIKDTIANTELKSNINKQTNGTAFTLNHSVVITYHSSIEALSDKEFFSLFFYGLGYIKNNMKMKKNFFENKTITDGLIILKKDATVNNTVPPTLLKNNIEEFKIDLEKKEELNNDKIDAIKKDKEDLDGELENLKSTNSKQFNSNISVVEDEIRIVKQKITKYQEDLRLNQIEIDKIETSRRKLGAGITPAETAKINDLIAPLEIIKNNLTASINTEKDTNLQNLEFKKNKLLLTKEQREKNIELIGKKIKLQDDLIAKYEDLKKTNPFVKFKPQEFIAFDESLKTFRKNIENISKTTTTSTPIASYFTQNYLYYSLFFEKNRTTLKNRVIIDLKALLTLKLFFSKSKPQIIKNENKEKNPEFNEDFMSEIFKFIDNPKFIDFLKNYDKKFKDTIIKLLKENRRETEFNLLASTVDTTKNIGTLVNIIKKCIDDEGKANRNKTKIYPYTNFIIAYFSLYLIIINLILENLIK